MSDTLDTIGLEFETLGESTNDNERLASDSVAGLDLRITEFLEIRTAQTLTFTVEPSFDIIHNYTLGIFSNGTAVPSPSFERCLPVTTLSLDSTQSVLLPGKDTRDDERWYSIDLESGSYQLDASTSSIETAAIGYQFSSFNGFADEGSRETLSSDSVAGLTLTTSETFERDRDGLVWIRLENLFPGADRTVEFTITRQ